MPVNGEPAGSFRSAGDQMANQKNRKTIDCGYHKAVAVTYILGYIISSIDMVTDKCPSFVTIQVIYLQNRGYRVKTAITLEEALPDGSGEEKEVVLEINCEEG